MIRKKRKKVLDPRPLICEVIASAIVPQHQVFNTCVKLIIFNVLAREILPTDAI